MKGMSEFLCIHGSLPSSLHLRFLPFLSSSYALPCDVTALFLPAEKIKMVQVHKTTCFKDLYDDCVYPVHRYENNVI
jgi:hypothetical protein